MKIKINLYLFSDAGHRYQGTRSRCVTDEQRRRKVSNQKRWKIFMKTNLINKQTSLYERNFYRAHLQINT